MRTITTCLFVLITSILSLQAQSLTHGPVFGAVTDQTARIFVRTSSATSVRIKYSTHSNLSSATTTSAYSTSSGNDYTKIITIPESGSLSTNTKYFVNVLIGSSQTPAFTSSYPNFYTMPTEGNDAAFDFVFGSCQGRSGYLTPAIWTQVAAQNPIAFIQTGDFGYPRSTNLSTQRSNFQTQYSNTAFYDNVLKTTPFFHVWDDNDMGPNDADGNTSGKSNSLQAFKEYIPTPTLVNPTKGIWHSFKIGNAEFFMLDLRYQRDKDGTTNGSMMGNTTTSGNQLDWFINSVNYSTSKWQFVISSVVFNGTSSGGGELWADYDPNDTERTYIVNNIQRSNVIFLTGDRHAAAIDDGRNSDFVEALSGDFESSLSGANGSWSQGSPYSSNHILGHVSVQTSPQQLFIEIIDQNGTQRMNLTVPYIPDSSLPVYLLSFSSFNRAQGVLLTWETDTEIDNIGFSLERRSIPDSAFIQIADYSVNPELAGAGTTAEPHWYQFYDQAADSGKSYEYRLFDHSFNGERTLLASSKIMYLPQELSPPQQFVIRPNYPNPFNGSTTVSFTANEMSPANTQVMIYNNLGQRIKMLAQEMFLPGQYSMRWNGKDDNNRNVSSGRYYLVVKNGNSVSSQPMVLLK